MLAFNSTCGKDESGQCTEVCRTLHLVLLQCHAHQVFLVGNGWVISTAVADVRPWNKLLTVERISWNSIKMESRICTKDFFLFFLKQRVKLLAWDGAHCMWPLFIPCLVPVARNGEVLHTSKASMLPLRKTKTQWGARLNKCIIS